MQTTVTHLAKNHQPLFIKFSVSVSTNNYLPIQRNSSTEGQNYCHRHKSIESATSWSSIESETDVFENRQGSLDDNHAKVNRERFGSSNSNSQGPKDGAHSNNSSMDDNLSLKCEYDI